LISSDELFFLAIYYIFSMLSFLMGGKHNFLRL